MSGYTLRVLSLTGGEHIAGTVTWDGGWQVDGDLPWLFDGFEAVLPGWVEPVHVTPDEGEDFLFAAWYSIRSSHAWGEMLDPEGRVMEPSDAMAECERRAAARQPAEGPDRTG